MPLTVGQTLQNRYRIVALLGEGGMGAVYRAEDLRLRVSVALKEMVPQPGLDPESLRKLRDQFEQEAITLARMKHPHLVSVSDFFTEGDRAYLVMAFVDGESLAARIHRVGALPEAQVALWAGQLLDALAYCHAQGVIHRDIKPQNVVITPEDEAVLVDFGLVKLWDPADPQTRTVMRGMGTPEYAPPEQWGAAGHHTDPRSDVYSLGATLFHALVGQAPLSASERMAFPDQDRPPRDVNARISVRMDLAIQRAMALARDARWGSAREMAAALAGAPSPDKTSSLPLAGQPSRQRRPAPWFAALAVLLVIPLVVASIVLAQRWRAAAAGQPPSIEATQDAPLQAVDDPGPQASAAVFEEIDPVPAFATESVADTASPVPAASPTPQGPPTSTPQPAPTPTPQPSDTPVCPPVEGVFAGLWQAERGRLGCARNDAFSALIAEETFEGGYMFWREPVDTAQAMVLFNDGYWRVYQHASFVEGSPEFPCADADTPAQCPPTPKRGFGTMWCDIPEIRGGLGRAVDCERGYTGALQFFERGSALRTDTGAIYVFYADERWARW